MSRLEELLKELCPDGVEYKQLKDICKRQKGISITAGEMKKINKPGAPVRIFAGGNTFADVNIDDIDGNNILHEPSIIVKSRGNIGFVYYDQLFSHKNELWSYSKKTDKINLKFVYYYLSNHTRDFQNMAKSGKLPQISTPNTDNYRIPIPPLEIQSEIVKVLDNFTELTAELTARKKQYEYYRDKLLTFEDRKVTFLKLNEIASVFRGEYITKKNSNPGNIPVILGGQEPAYFIDRYNHQGEVVAVARSGVSAGFVSYWNEPIFITDGFGYEPKEGIATAKYLYYILKNKQKELNDMKRGGGVPHLSGELLGKVKLPVPSIEIQKRIVYVLDHFDAVCHDLHIGLPAEIEARKKQYEYYRDSLLTFMEKDSLILNRTEQNRCLIRLLQYVFGYVWIPLSDLAKNCDAERKPVKQGNRKKGQYPYYGASGIVDYVEDYLFDGEYLLISEDGANLVARSTPIAFSIHGKNWVNNHAHVLKFTDSSLQKFVEFYLNGLDLNSILIPVPDEKELKRRISVLETFDTICNDLNAGLPAEIEARKKQYEYYRDRLLNFPEKRLSK